MKDGITNKRINRKLIKGKIKVLPDDFIVAEILRRGIRFTDHGYPLIRVKKYDVSHADLMRKLGKTNLFGIKDKRATTYQFGSVRSRDAGKNIYLDGIEIRSVGYTKEVLTRKWLMGNAFKVKVVSDESWENPVKDWVEIVKGLKVPNYFGPQRFGGHNIEIGRAIVMRNFSEAEGYLATEGYHSLRDVPLWLRRLYVQAYQSYLFNMELSLIVNEERKGPTSLVEVNEGPFRADVPVGPLPGFSFRPREDIYSKSLADVLTMEGLRPRDFYIDRYQELSVEGGFRQASVIIAKVSYSTAEDGFILKFLLERGCYATTALRELLLEG